MLDDIANKYNNTVYRTIKIKPIDVADDSYAEYNEDSNKKDPSFRCVNMLEFQNTKTFLIQDMLQIGRKKFLLTVKLEIQSRGHMSDLSGEETIGSV